jgi:hypothetical protein
MVFPIRSMMAFSAFPGAYHAGAIGTAFVVRWFGTTPM